MSKRRNQSPIVLIKNALRPFFRASKQIRRTSQFQTIRQTIPLENLAELYRITEHNPLYQFAGMGNTFPQEPNHVPDPTLQRLAPLSLAREIALHAGRLNYHETDVAGALQSLASINDEIRLGNWTAAEVQITAHREVYGVSLALLRKDLLTSFQTLGVNGLSRKYKQLIHGFDRTAWALIAHINYDLIDPAFNPDRAARLWLRRLRSRLSNSNYYARPASSEILSRWSSKAELSDALLRYSGTSLLDLALCLWKAHAAHPTWSELNRLGTFLSPNLWEILNSRFSASTVHIPERYYLSSKGPSDIDVFRAAFFFQEDAPVARWRSSFMSLLYPQSGQSEIAKASALQIMAISDALYQDESVFGISYSHELLEAGVRSVLDRRLALSSTTFVKSVVIASLLRRTDVSTDFSPEQMIKILTGTNNIHLYLEQDIVEELLIIDKFKESRLLVFLLRDMIFRQARTEDNELDRRAAFMQMFAVGGREEIVPLLDTVSVWSLRSAMYVARICTRTFLERLYLLVESVKEVVETRIAICTWMQTRGGRDDESINEERAALERELGNLDARSDLDSTRVHVDEDSLREWYNNTQKASEQRYQQTVLAEGESVTHGTFLEFYSRSRDSSKQADGEEDLLADAQIGSEFILLQIFEDTLSAFVNDRTFGLDSYLSRRIRHGTLRGFLTTPLARIRRRLDSDIEKEERAVERESLRLAAAKLDAWFAMLAKELDYLRLAVIQVASDQHPSGLIEATWRTATNVRHLDAMMARTRARVISDRGGGDIFSDVYLLCWDFLERDLARIRLHLNREFFPKMALELWNQISDADDADRRVSYQYWREISSVLNAKVQEMCGWFIRPVFRRDAYNLRTLVESTISIIRELDESYRFIDVLQIDRALIINRGSFDVVGDILFSLIGNAAKHGKPNGRLQVTAKAIGEDNELLEIAVASESDDLAALRKAEASIRRAINAPDMVLIQMAGVIEGFSGIRKVLGLLNRVRHPKADLAFDFDSERLLVVCRVVVPSTIAFARERT